MKIQQREYVIESKLDWQLLGEEMSKHYGKPMYSIINKFKKTRGIEYISDAFIQLEKEKNHNVVHLLNKLHNS